MNNHGKTEESASLAEWYVKKIEFDGEIKDNPDCIKDLLIGIAYDKGVEDGLKYAEQMIENYINNRTSFFPTNYICGLRKAQIIVRQIRRGEI